MFKVLLCVVFGHQDWCGGVLGDKVFFLSTTVGGATRVYLCKRCGVVYVKG